MIQFILSLHAHIQRVQGHQPLPASTITQFGKAEHGIQEKCQYSLFPRILPKDKLDSSGWVELWWSIL